MASKPVCGLVRHGAALLGLLLGTVTGVSAQDAGNSDLANSDLGNREISVLGVPLPLTKPAAPDAFALRASVGQQRASRLFEGRIGDAALGEGVVIFGPSSGGALSLDLLEQLGSASARGLDVSANAGDGSVRNESDSARLLRDRAAAAAMLVAKEPPLSLTTARLRALDKITARLSTLRLPVGSSQNFGNLAITAKSCQKTPPSEPPEDAAFLVIEELTAEGRLEERFSGWMFASNPAMSALEHPIYDVWVEACTND